MTSISDRVLACLDQFGALSALLEVAAIDGPAAAPDLSPSLLGDQLARFKVWTGNIGAHRKGRSSLDYRLRDASHIHTRVNRLLDDLSESLQDAASICRGETIPWDEELEDEMEHGSEEEGGDSPHGPATELSQIADDISEILDCLFRLSVSIRNPAPHDRLLKSTLTSTSHHEPFDIAHAREMFPLASAELVKRLGTALSRRRQYFLYREMRHKKLSRGLEEGDEMTEDAGASTIASSIPGHLKDTKADSVQAPVVDEDQTSESGWTETTQGSLAESARPRIPPLPADAHERPFECQFCYMMVSATTTAAWTKHVLADLQPYICLAPECFTPHEQFQTRRQWMHHAARHHWSSWVCAVHGCQQPFESAVHLSYHVQDQHGDLLTQVPPDAIVDMSESQRPLTTASACPLCNEPLASRKEYARHVGRHQRHLALFALPRVEMDEDEGHDPEKAANTDEYEKGDVEQAANSDSVSSNGGDDGTNWDAQMDHDMPPVGRSADMQDLEQTRATTSNCYHEIETASRERLTARLQKLLNEFDWENTNPLTPATVADNMETRRTESLGNPNSSRHARPGVPNEEINEAIRVEIMKEARSYLEDYVEVLVQDIETRMRTGEDLYASMKESLSLRGIELDKQDEHPQPNHDPDSHGSAHTVVTDAPDEATRSSAAAQQQEHAEDPRPQAASPLEQAGQEAAIDTPTPRLAPARTPPLNPQELPPTTPGSGSSD